VWIGDFMTQDVNKKIIEKIKESDFDHAIKEFLKQLLFYELDNISEARWRYSEKYDSAIKKYYEKFKGDEF
jgi:hypothetical protein